MRIGIPRLDPKFLILRPNSQLHWSETYAKQPTPLKRILPETANSIEAKLMRSSQLYWSKTYAKQPTPLKRNLCETANSIEDRLARHRLTWYFFVVWGGERERVCWHEHERAVNPAGLCAGLRQRRARSRRNGPILKFHRSHILLLTKYYYHIISQLAGTRYTVPYSRGSIVAAFHILGPSTLVTGSWIGFKKLKMTKN